MLAAIGGGAVALTRGGGDVPAPATVVRSVATAAPPTFVPSALPSAAPSALASAAASVSATPAATPAPSSTPAVTATPPTSGPRARTPVVATIPVTAGKSVEERNIIRTINEANQAYIEAYRAADITGLDTYLTGAALTDQVSQINGGLKRQGRYAIADLTGIEMLGITSDQPGMATVKTREHLSYDEYLLFPEDQPVPGSGYTATTVWTYHLFRKDGAWLIDRADPVTESSTPH
jgi:hypothetical protein